jgi:hypothetical protein
MRMQRTRSAWRAQGPLPAVAGAKVAAIRKAKSVGTAVAAAKKIAKA